jgi:hypothetical protein
VEYREGGLKRCQEYRSVVVPDRIVLAVRGRCNSRDWVKYGPRGDMLTGRWLEQNDFTFSISCER